MPKFWFGVKKKDYTDVKSQALRLFDSQCMAEEYASGIYNPGAEARVYNCTLDMTGLKVLDFCTANVHRWLAEVYATRKLNNTDASDTYMKELKGFIAQHRAAVDNYDVLLGWRTDGSLRVLAEWYFDGEITIVTVQNVLFNTISDIEIKLNSRKALDALTLNSFYVPGDQKESLAKYINKEVLVRAEAKEYSIDIPVCYDDFWPEWDKDSMAYLFQYCDTYASQRGVTSFNKVKFLTDFLNSGYRAAMEIGNPGMLSKSGAEVFDDYVEVELDKVLYPYIGRESMFNPKAFAWAGRIYAYAHFKTKLPSREIVAKLPVERVLEAFEIYRNYSYVHYFDEVSYLFNR